MAEEGKADKHPTPIPLHVSRAQWGAGLLTTQHQVGGQGRWGPHMRLFPIVSSLLAVSPRGKLNVWFMLCKQRFFLFLFKKIKSASASSFHGISVTQQGVEHCCTGI
jgi:hypothetical protein